MFDMRTYGGVIIDNIVRRAYPKDKRDSHYTSPEPKYGALLEELEEKLRIQNTSWSRVCFSMDGKGSVIVINTENIQLRGALLRVRHTIVAYDEQDLQKMLENKQNTLAVTNTETIARRWQQLFENAEYNIKDIL